MHKNLINGEWLDGHGIARNINPSDTRDLVGEYAQADRAQTELAITAAAAAFPAWSLSTPQQRFDILDAVGTEILARRAELGELLAREEGKTLPEAIGEVVRAGNIFKFFAGEALRPGGEALPSVRPGVGVEITREAVGIVGLITPWNFPIAIPAWKIAPALAHGNCVVFKPAELVPGSAWALAEILSRSGLPAGVFNLVMGRGSEVGQTLLNDPRVAAVSFTGSVATGQKVAAACAARMARFQLEMGGKNPMVVLDDADLGVAVNAAVNSGFFSTGQRCTASSRLIVTEGIHDRFVGAMAERMKTLKIDDARKAGTDIGPVVDAGQLGQDMDYIGIAQAEGGRLAQGGARIEHNADGAPGFYLTPALITDTTPAMRINREEVFGPVVSVIRARDYEHALALANDTPFGLAAGIATTSLKHATHFKRHAQAGMVMVNLPTAGVDYHVPFGGRKASSYGPREQGRHAAEFYTTVKTAYTQA
ncbi:aldehyde dehydrogenase family protein [Roseateles saccharophilus]|uniref:Aldehyde dehydrogenase (NAD+) n=1 Tax=Roseateles saccharophilus TaxID=304 RepID=A0A4R3UTN4_ROSSA|nr:aldehyde dehydrogenase family protein [Roseateles saccharophilus]MDG0832680.1 aldehyde dehydrogenase family protein [Roseateles saccharophilus]TCU95386.1 aldehyde dehydrogenase (NAD+) [Roseateles saccharophilus]